MTPKIFAVIMYAGLLTGCADRAPSQSQSQNETGSHLTRTVTEGYISPEVLQGSPAINGTSLRSAAISPDGKRVTVLRGRDDDADQLDLWAYDIISGEASMLVSSTDLLGKPETLSEEEKNRRERAREYGKGIVSYQWVDKDRLMFPLGGDVFLYDLKNKQSQQVTSTAGFETDAKVSPLGKHIAYVRDNELYTADLATGAEVQLTQDASDVVRNATASFVVQEELDRSTGYWWAPFDNRLAYTQIDESPIAIENRIDFGAAGIKNISQRYPFAGTDNATVKLGIVPRTGGQTVWADIGSDPDIYLTRVFWAADGKALYAGILARDHKTHTFYKINPNTGRSQKIYSDSSPTWLNIGSDNHALKEGGFLWSSEKSGKRQIYKISPDGSDVQITPDSVLVRNIRCVDKTSGKIYFAGWDKTPLEQHVYAINMDGSDLIQLSEGEGKHGASFASNCASYIGYFSNPQTPPQTRAFDNAGKGLTWLSENKLDGNHPYAPYMDNHIDPVYGQIKAKDGTPLDYSLFKPIDLKPGEKRPSITIVYGGPGVQRIEKSWGRQSYARMLAHHGFVVFQIDGRGATNRGKAFEDHLYRSMGRAEVIDQTAGANWLKAQDFIDPDRMGVYGWSYGGYMTLHMLAQTDLYKSGVSGAPVTDWALYDTAYTERYLGSPNPDHQNYTEGAYEDGSVFPYLDGLTEDVLLIHGMADDNVVFRHSVKFMDVMQDRGASNMRVMTYPGEKHGFRRKSNKIHRDHMIIDFFVETLGE